MAPVNRGSSPRTTSVAEAGAAAAPGTLIVADVPKPKLPRAVAAFERSDKLFAGANGV